MLPKIDVPIYDLKLISNNKKIRFRPFTVKEEKLFLMAMEANDTETTINTIKQVLNNCVLDDVNIENLPIFDLELLFLNLRAKSIGEEINLKYRCANNVEKEGKQEKCNNVVDFSFNVLDILPEKNENHTNKIEINDDLGIVMKYPSFEMLQKYQTNNDFDIILALIIDCIDYVYDKDNIYYAKDTQRNELEEFIDSLQSKELEKLKLFFDTMPKLKKKLDFKCNKCGYEEEIEVEGIQNFFV